MSDEKLSERKADVADDENPEWTTADFNRARPASEVFGTDAAAAFVRPRGRPAKAPEARKRQVTLRLSPDVLKAARATGSGWQTRVDTVLRREFLGDDPIAAKERISGRSLGEVMREATKAAKASVKPSVKIGRSAQTGKVSRITRTSNSADGKKHA